MRDPLTAQKLADAKRENALGVTALRDSDPARAALHFAAATACDPTSDALWMNLAKACRLRGDDDAERTALEAVLALDQRHLMALIRLAELHERRHELAQATERWTGVLALSAEFHDLPASISTLIEHGSDFVETRQSTLAKAIDKGLGNVSALGSLSEQRRFTAARDALLGYRKIYANVCEGLHYPFLPADEFFDREHFPWFDRIEAATPAIRAELQEVLSKPNSGLSPYVSMAPGTPVNKWSPLDGSLDWGALHLWREGERIDQMCDRAPQTAALVESLPLARISGRAPTVFFSILQPGSVIPPHNGVTNTRAIIHLPLIVPANCAFRVGGEIREWREGVAFAFDDTIEHEAWNRSDQLRAVLIFDVWNPYLSIAERDLVCKLFAIVDQN